jgi:hypothetical protein
MKIQLYLLLFIFYPVFATSQDWTVMTNNNEYPGSYVHISGETNINCFECNYDKNRDHQSTDNAFVKYPQVSGQTIKTYIPVSEFECSNSVMYNDFQELLNSSEFPYITIEIDPSQIRNILPDKSSTDLNFSITIADVTNVQNISCGINNYPNSTMSITGEATIHLADFQIKPPVKLMGLIKVKDEVTIKFYFNFIVV